MPLKLKEEIIYVKKYRRESLTKQKEKIKYEQNYSNNNDVERKESTGNCTGNEYDLNGIKMI